METAGWRLVGESRLEVLSTPAPMLMKLRCNIDSSLRVKFKTCIKTDEVEWFVTHAGEEVDLYVGSIAMNFTPLIVFTLAV